METSNNVFFRIFNFEVFEVNFGEKLSFVYGFNQIFNLSGVFQEALVKLGEDSCEKFADWIRCINPFVINYFRYGSAELGKF